MLRENKKKYLLYADGGGKMGLGHLSRLKTLSKKLNISNEALFLFDNHDQRNFYNESYINAEDISKFTSKNHQFELFFIDTKRERRDILNIVKNYTKYLIILDNDTPFQYLFDCSVNPSFYSPSRNKKHIQTDTRILSGFEYSIIRDEFIKPSKKPLKSKPDLKNCTLSFGGVDPNNITLRVLRELSSDKSILEDLIIILGPGYNHDENKLFNFINEDQVIRNPKNMHQYFASSYFVITALGVTVQELFSMGVRTGVIANYFEDIDDIDKIQHFSKKHLGIQAENLISYFGHYQNIDNKKLINNIKEFKAKKILQNPFLSMGIGWKSFLNEIGSI